MFVRPAPTTSAPEIFRECTIFMYKHQSGLCVCKCQRSVVELNSDSFAAHDVSPQINV